MMGKFNPNFKIEKHFRFYPRNKVEKLKTGLLCNPSQPPDNGVN